ncbi:MAG: hypothetical protein NC412_03510 [Roseburia sp.]|nr:hypothetical protein [Roseburia sp.]MCM1279571.1 hypothetical protein [Robinsoniella sp.]
MDEQRLKEVMERVHIKSEMEEEILKNLMNETEGQATKKKANKSAGWQKKVAVAAIAVVCAGTVGFSANAIRNNMVKARMEAVPKLEMEEILNDIDSAEVEADTYSRELTSEEMSRETALRSEYLNGRFPEKELIKVREESDIVDKDTLCFAAKTSYFNIPDRELTDEEILQIIDFGEKREYALRQRYEEMYADEIQEQEAAEQAAKEELEAKGGITEEEAVIKAQEWLMKMFGKTTDGLECNHYLMTDEEGNAGEDPVYMVYYGVIHENYYFTISAEDGSLVRVDCGIGDSGIFDDEMKVSDVEANIPELYQIAEGYLRNNLDISDEFKAVHYTYFATNSDTIYSNTVGFCFVKEDGSAYSMNYVCTDNSFLGYEKIDNYEEHLAGRKEHDEWLSSDVSLDLKERIEKEVQ